MPYYRRRYYGRYNNYRKYRRQARKYRKIRSYGRLAATGFRMARKALSLVNTEFKSSDVEISELCSTTPTVVLLNGTQKGDDLNNREGRQIRIKSIQSQLTFTYDTSANGVSLVRYAFFIDKQANGSSTNVANDLFDDPIDGFRDLNNRKRFVILKTGLVRLNDDDLPQRIYRWFKRMNMHTVYDAGNAGNIGDIHTNALYLFLSSDEATFQPACQGRVRIRFIDN